MVKMNSSTYEPVTIDGVKHGHDVYVLPSGKVEEREYGRTFTKDQAKYVLKEDLDIVVIRKGTSGLASLNGDARTLLEKREVEIIEAYTLAIVDKFKKLAETKKVAAIIHVTC